MQDRAFTESFPGSSVSGKDGSITFIAPTRGQRNRVAEANSQVYNMLVGYSTLEHNFLGKRKRGVQ